MNPEPARPVLLECFADLADPRIDRCQEHKLTDIVFIAICAVVCGAESFTEMEEFGQAKETWLRQFLALPNGIPSHDTFNRVFARLKPQAFHDCFVRWVQEVAQLTEGEVVAIDGKTLRRSHRKGSGQAAIELVSAWARTNRLTLGQVKVAPDSNEITAVPELLRVLALKGCIVTVDALNTQKEIATLIRQQEADYVLALKANHGTLHTAVREFFDSVRGNRTAGFQLETYQTVDGEHGRIETRNYWHVTAPEWLPGFADWADLRSLALVEATREVQGKTSTELRYYLSSLPVEVRRLSEAVRGHWAIENSCHWVLDVVLREDDSRVRTGFAAENFALVRRIALNLLQREKTLKRGIQTKRFKAALNERYLLKIINT